jgi:hypothetical protein
MAQDERRPPKIMLLRHAEKPPGSPPPHGVTEEGKYEDESLTVRGWQRAGALAALLATPDGVPRDPLLAEPRFIFASTPSRRNGSRRSLETVTPLAERLCLRVNVSYARDDYEEMLEEVFTCRGVVLISWQHDIIPKIANHILGDQTTAPQEWDTERYDLTWVFDRDPQSGLYSFTQAPQNLLAGDRPQPIRTERRES